MNKQFLSWHEHFFNSLDELGTFFEEDDISLDFITFKQSTIDIWKRDLLKLIDLAKALSINEFNNKPYLPSAHKELINLYKNRFWAPSVLRPDAIINNGQLKLIELNFDSSSIEGLYEINFIRSLLRKNPLTNNNSNTFSSDIIFSKFIKSVLKSSKQNIAIVIDSDMSRYDKDIAEETSNWVNNNTDLNCTIRMQETLFTNGDYISDGQLEYEAIYIYTTLMDADYVNAPLVDLLRDSYQTKTIVISDPKDLSIDCKDSLCLLYEYANSDDSKCTKEEAILIEKYIPMSFSLNKERNIKTEENYQNASNFVFENKDRFVLKKMHSFYGKHVIKGSLCTNAEWADSINKALTTDNTWMAQEAIESDYFQMKYFDATNKKLYEADRRIVIGPYILGNEIANFLVRVEKDPNTPILRRLTDGNMGLAFVGTEQS